jgi:hypothetical protein
MGELQLKGTDIAAAIGMTQGSFSRRYTGSAAWELDELALLEKKTGIRIAYLLGLEDPAEPGTLTGAIMRIEPAGEQQHQQQQQQAGAEYVVVRPAFRDRALFTGPIARIA